MIIGVLLLIVSIVFFIKRHTEEQITKPFSGSNLIILILDIAIILTFLVMFILSILSIL